MEIDEWGRSPSRKCGTPDSCLFLLLLHLFFFDFLFPFVFNYFLLLISFSSLYFSG